jgi:hypothetical protein
MKPSIFQKRSLIKRAKYRYPWFKSMKKFLRNNGQTVTDKAIGNF